MQITLPNGIILDNEGGWAASATEYAKRKGLEDIQVAKATHPDGTEEYVIIQYKIVTGLGDPIFANTSYEAIVGHIDVLWLKTMPD